MVVPHYAHVGVRLAALAGSPAQPSPTFGQTPVYGCVAGVGEGGDLAVAVAERLQVQRGALRRLEYGEVGDALGVLEVRGCKLLDAAVARC